MTDSVDWSSVALGLFGGLALFLIGMDQMTNALKALAGHRLQRILSSLSRNRVSGALTGTVTTAALQSSTITTVLGVGFVAAEMLTVRQAASVIIGANLGSTVTAQIIALNVSEFALALIAVGALLWLFVPNRTWKNSGQAFAALGLVFFGLKVMSDAMLPLASYEPVLNILRDAGNPLLALLAGAVITALIQSSSATIGIVIALGATGLIDLPTGIAMVLGANIGTCLTAVLAALGKGRPAMRTAVVHVLINVIGAIIWLLLLEVLVDIVEFFNPAEIASPRQLANAHTVFNLANTILFLIFLTPLVSLATRLVPDKRVSEIPIQPGEFLDTTATGTAALGLPAAAKEAVTMGMGVHDFFEAGFTNALTVPVSGAIPDEEIEAMKHRLRAQHRAIVGYLAELGHSAKDDAQSRQLLALVSEADEFAHLADSLSSSFRRINRRRRRTGVSLGPHVDAQLLAEAQTVGAAFGSAVMGLDTSPQLSSDEPVMPADRLIAARDMDRYVLESDLRDVLARVRLATERINEARTAIQEDETLR